MKTCTVTLYTYSELDEQAQKRARDAARARGWYGDAWSEEWRDSLTKAADALDFRVKGWSIDPCGRRGTYCDVEVTDDDVAELQGARAWKYLRANYADAIATDCPFTGVMSDETLLGPLRAFLKRPNTHDTVQDIMDACADAWATGWAEDIEFQTLDEYVAEDLEANGYDFTATDDFH